MPLQPTSGEVRTIQIEKVVNAARGWAAGR